MQLRSSIAVTLLLGASAFAQPGGRHPGMGPGGPGDFAFVRGEFGSGKLVKGSPYSAQSVTQFTQTLADGTHINRTNTVSITRDSAGRTRTESSVKAIGSMTATAGTAAKTVFIHDPVAGMSYVLDASNRTARQMKAPSREQWFQSSDGSATATAPRQRPGGGNDSARAAAHQREQASVKREDLGTQTMQGLSVVGKRTTRTVAAGQFGNDKAFEIVTETWYSSELQAVVMSKTSDPRMGEYVYQLSNVVRAEPDPALFSVPSDYTLQSAPAGRMHRGGPPSSNQ